MTPAARVQAAIEALDAILAGQAAEQVLTGWARRSRFAGSKDRAAVRDLVFDALRNLRSSAALGGSWSGRGVMLGELRRQGQDPEAVFTGKPYAPEGLSSDERLGGRDPQEGAEACDIPDWLWPAFSTSLGSDAMASAGAMKVRAPVHLRVNLARGTRAEMMARLREQGVETRPHPAAASALEVLDGARRIRTCLAYADGDVELQDAASQAVIETLPLSDGMRVLDYCAGGGGKALAMAARAGITLFAHDADSRRMRDLPSRAARAGITCQILDTASLDAAGPFDLVLCDVPCSGSGAWRRAPDGKWRLTADRLAELGKVQAGILDRAARLVPPNGTLAYATCSLLTVENTDQIARFTARAPEWQAMFEQSWGVKDATDGFFVAHLTRV